MNYIMSKKLTALFFDGAGHFGGFREWIDKPIHIANNAMISPFVDDEVFAVYKIYLG